MKWSNQKCRKVAFVISLCYVLLGILFFRTVDHIEYNEYLGRFLVIIFSPMIIPVVMLFIYEKIILFIFIILIWLLIIWGILYGIIWLIKGEKS